MKIEPSIDQAFQDHADRIASGFAAMSPKPARQPFFHNTQNMTAPTATETATETTESSTQQVIRESGLVGAFELTLTALADIEPLTSDLLAKKEKAELLDLNAACIRLADEVQKANSIAINPAKVALAWHAENPGQPVPQNLIETAANGEELRRCAKTTAKVAAGLFFDEQAVPAIRNVFSKAAALLANVITDRVKAEQDAFEKFAAVFHDGDEVAYAPSTGLLRLMARRRQLLDFEILRTSPPSISGTLQGIYRMTQP
jgi:hypothetical protein